ncbi:MAG TPA: EAL domain-containing protein [Thermoanaerobaculia bacterium]|nr:EAL domain-containing protein [Thermoanaerobaculia bacterium]
MTGSRAAIEMGANGSNESPPQRRENSDALLEIAGDLEMAFWEADPETQRFRFVSGGIAPLLGCSPAERRWEPEFGAARVHPEDRPAYLALFRTPAPGRLAIEYRASTDDGRERWLRDVFRFRYGDVGRPVAIHGATADVTPRKDAEQAARRSEERYRFLFDESLAGIFRMTEEGALLDCNEAFARIFGYPSREAAMAGREGEMYFDDRDRDRIVQLLTAEGKVSHAEMQVRRGDGKPMWVLGTFTRLTAETPAVFEGALVDITGRKKAEVLIEYQAFHDGLTGLANRKLFRDRLVQALAVARRKRRRLAVLFFDVDHFKLINDRFGHESGDQLLQEIAVRLVKAVRKIDTVARLGGDEFTLLLLDTDTADGAVRVARKLLEAMAPPFSIGGRTLSASASIGISLYPDDGDDEETLVRNSDAAMYRAKELGRNNCQLYTRALQVRAMRRLTLEAELKGALSRGELEVHFQPQVRVADGQIRGFEALLRWRGADGNMISPGEFIPVAEESNLILEIGEWVLREACRRAREWHDAGFADVTVAVNVSPRQVQFGGLLDIVGRTIAESGIRASTLELEVTESVAMQDVEHTRALFFALRGLGARIAIDDFGTGHSSLSYVKHLPVHTLKIDQSFVRDIPGSSADEAIIGAIVHMAGALRLRVLAEGVETIAQRDLLVRQKCGEMQGFLFSRALPAPAAMALLQEASGRA